MSYAIVGAGAIGSALATQFHRKGVDVLVANQRGPASLVDFVQKLSPQVTAVALSSALQADIVILAVPFKSIADLARSAPDWNGRIVIDATNAIDFPAFTPTDPGGRSSSEVVAEAVPGARLVKAFNTLPAALLAAEPEQNGGRRVLFFSGDDEDANAQVAGLINRLGFAGIWLGNISEGGRLQQFAGPLVLHNLIKSA